MQHQLITIMILLPFLGAIVQAVVSSPEAASEKASVGRWIAFGTSLVASINAVLAVSFQIPEPGALETGERLSWLGSYSVTYDVGVDGMNAMMVLLIAVIFPILILHEWRRERGVRGIHGLFLLLQSALFGAVCSHDLFLTFFFWAITALPIYFLIAIWGGEKREAAATQHMVVASLGNALLFLVLVLVYFSVSPQTFAIRDLIGGKMEGKTLTLFNQELSVSSLAFFLLCAGFSCRIPVWPLHGWFSGLATQSPTSVLVAICGAVVPCALGIFTRLAFSLFPKEFTHFTDYVIWIGAINVLFGAASAMAQRGLPLLMGFLCVVQIGITLIGIGSLDATSVVGSVYFGLTGGLAIAGFGLMIGLLRDRVGHTDFATDTDGTLLGDLANRAPVMTFIMGCLLIALLGFPGSGGFVSQALVMMGGYGIYPYAVICLAASLLLLTYGLFSMYRLVFLGKPGVDSDKVSDLSLQEQAYLFMVVAALLATGVYPRPLLDLVKPAVMNLLSLMKA